MRMRIISFEVATCELPQPTPALVIKQPKNRDFPTNSPILHLANLRGTGDLTAQSRRLSTAKKLVFAYRLCGRRRLSKPKSAGLETDGRSVNLSQLGPVREYNYTTSRTQASIRTRQTSISGSQTLPSTA